jgi:hypothetical protein
MLSRDGPLLEVVEILRICHCAKDWRWHDWNWVGNIRNVFPVSRKRPIANRPQAASLPYSGERHLDHSDHIAPEGAHSWQPQRRFKGA